MLPEENILNFLKTYNKDDPVHRETYEMFKEADDNIEEAVLSLIDSGVNIENLQTLISKNRSFLEEEKDHAEKRIKIEEKSTEEIGFEIPGLIGDDESEIKAEDRFIKYTSINNDNCLCKGDVMSEIRTPQSNLKVNQNNDGLNKYSNPTVINKSIDPSVFYQNILPIPSPKQPLAPASPEYLFPILQCKLCGLRFPDSSEVFTQHIEDHRRFTNALGEKVVLRREFFTPKILNKTEKLDLNFEGDTEDVIWEKESPFCSVCGKIIKKKWEDQIENWILEDGVRINDKEVSHRKCVY